MRKHPTRLVIVLLTLPALGAIFIFGTFLIFHAFGFPTSAADFGQSFGFASAIISGLALAAVAYTLWQQQQLLRQGQQQLELQKDELQQNTAMLAAQRDEMKRQNELLAHQEFENRFFRLLDSFHNQISSLSLTKGNKIFLGRQAINFACQQLINLPRRDHPEAGHKELRKHIDGWYTRFYRQYGNPLGHYFRMVYRMLLFIHESGLSSEDKLLFSRLFRAHLSQDELTLLFYNGLSDYGYSKQGRNIEGESFNDPTTYELLHEYDLLLNIDPETLKSEKDLELYPKLKAGEIARRRKAIS